MLKGANSFKKNWKNWNNTVLLFHLNLTDFETSVIIGERLLALTKGVKNWGKRDCFRQLQAYLNSEVNRSCMLGIWSATNRKDNNAASGCFRNDSITVRKISIHQSERERYHGSDESWFGQTPWSGIWICFYWRSNPDARLYWFSSTILWYLRCTRYENLFYPEQILLAFGLRFIRNFMIELLRFTLPLFHSVNIVVYSVSTVLTSTFAMAAHFVQEN